MYIYKLAKIMDENTLKIVKDYIEHRIDQEFNKHITISHNHPPIRILVDGCPFCEKFGNIFHLES